MIHLSTNITLISTYYEGRGDGNSANLTLTAPPFFYHNLISNYSLHPRRSPQIKALIKVPLEHLHSQNPLLNPTHRLHKASLQCSCFITHGLVAVTVFICEGGLLEALRGPCPKNSLYHLPLSPLTPPPSQIAQSAKASIECSCFITSNDYSVCCEAMDMALLIENR